jgi:hypothetical protein
MPYRLVTSYRRCGGAHFFIFSAEQCDEDSWIMKIKAPRFLESSETKRRNFLEELTEYFHRTAVAC